MRLFLVSFVSLLVVGMCLLTVRFWGLGRTVETYDHTWFHLSKPWIIAPYNLIEQAKPDAIIWLNVVQAEEGGLYVLHQTPDPNKRDWTEGELAGTATEFKKVLTQLENRNLILNVLSNKENLDLQISDTVGKTGRDRILVQSDYDVILRSIKKLQPMWLYGSSMAERVRIRTFESLWILPAAPFPGDVYVGPFKVRGIEVLTPALFEELKRRQKRIIVGPIQSKEEAELALRLGADGLLVERADLL